MKLKRRDFINSAAMVGAGVTMLGLIGQWRMEDLVILIQIHLMKDVRSIIGSLAIMKNA
jgi:hypothetical protein